MEKDEVKGKEMAYREVEGIYTRAITGKMENIRLTGRCRPDWSNNLLGKATY